MKNTNWEKSSGTPLEHFPNVVYPSVFDTYVGIYFFALLENALGFHESSHCIGEYPVTIIITITNHTITSHQFRALTKMIQRLYSSAFARFYRSIYSYNKIFPSCIT